MSTQIYLFVCMMLLCPIHFCTTGIGTPLEAIILANVRRKVWKPTRSHLGFVTDFPPTYRVIGLSMPMALQMFFRLRILTYLLCSFFGCMERYFARSECKGMTLSRLVFLLT